jgi:hypothetical protein
MPAHQNIFQDTHMAEKLDILKCARDSPLCDLMRLQGDDVLTFQQNVPAIGFIQRINDIKNGGLAGAIRPDQRKNFSFAYFE